MIDFSVVSAARGLTEKAACRRLAYIAQQVPAGLAIVELGSFRGRTTGWLAWGAEQSGRGVAVTAVDPWTDLQVPDVDGHLEIQYRRGDYAAPDTFSDFQAHLAACGADVRWQQGTAVDAAAGWDGPPVGLLFHDALHTADAVAADLAAWMPHMARASVVAAHDACSANFGVLEGASRVLPDAGYEWPPKVYPWKKHPERRGLMVARR
jgi:hypothetical protein